jgi:hypothetical protein
MSVFNNGLYEFAVDTAQIEEDILTLQEDYVVSSDDYQVVSDYMNDEYGTFFTDSQTPIILQTGFCSLEPPPFGSGNTSKFLATVFGTVQSYQFNTTIPSPLNYISASCLVENLGSGVEYQVQESIVFANSITPSSVLSINTTFIVDMTVSPSTNSSVFIDITWEGVGTNYYGLVEASVSYLRLN